MWNEHAERDLPEISVCHSLPKTWCASSRHAQYTNNPTLYKSAFARRLFQRAPKVTLSKGACNYLSVS